MDGLDGAAAEDLDDVWEVHLVEGKDLVSVEGQVGVGLARAVRQIEDAEPCLELLAQEGEEAALAGELADLHENGAAVGSLLLETGRLDPPVGVEGLAVFQPNAVDHAVAVEPVVLAEGLVEGVRTVPQEDPVQVLWDLSSRHGQVSEGLLLRGRGEVPSQKTDGLRWFAAGVSFRFAERERERERKVVSVLVSSASRAS